MKSLLIRMVIPIPAQSIVGVPAMVFHRWLPKEPEDYLVVERDNLRLTFWFDMPCTHWARQYPEEQLSDWINVSAYRINADVVVRDVSEELADFIIACQTLPAPS